VDVNTADFNAIIRIPGIGRQSAIKIVQARKFGRLYTYQLQKMGIAYNRAKYFLQCVDTPFILGNPSMEHVRNAILSERSSGNRRQAVTGQLTLF